MLTTKKAAIIFGGLFFLFFFLFSYFVEFSHPFNVSFDKFSWKVVLDSIEKYQLKGSWKSIAAEGKRGVPNFNEQSGTATLRLVITNINHLLVDLKNSTVEKDFNYVFQLRLTDGVSSSANSHMFLFKIPEHKTIEGNYHFSNVMSTNSEEGSGEATYTNEFRIELNDFENRRDLQEIEFVFKLVSTDPKFSTAVQMSFKYNDHQNRKQILRFVASGVLLAVYDMILIIVFVNNLNGFQYNFRFQSTIFWSSIAMMSCLNCFVTLQTASNFSTLIHYFLITSILNFINFALIVLKILSKHARMLQETSRFEEVNSAERPKENPQNVDVPRQNLPDHLSRSGLWNDQFPD